MSDQPELTLEGFARRVEVEFDILGYPTQHPIRRAAEHAIATHRADLDRVFDAALEAAIIELKVFAPVDVDGPEHDVGYKRGYDTALNRIRALKSDAALRAQITKGTTDGNS